MHVVGSLGQEAEEACQTLCEFFAGIEAAGGPALSAEDHRSMTAGIRADRGTFTISEER